MTSGEQMAEGQATFVMEHFRVVGPGRLEVEGRWSGVRGVDLDEPTLTLEVPDRVDQLEAESVRRSARAWHAIFRWDGDPSAVRRAVLEVGGQLMVELGTQPSPRRRLGRTSHPALAVVSQSPAEGEGEAGDLVAVHAALVVAQDQLAEAKDETELAREEARRAREDAARERARRQSEAARLHDGLGKVKAVADEALRVERERAQQQAAQVEELEHVVTGTRAESESLRNELAGAQAQLEQTSARNAELGVLLSDMRQEVDRLAKVEAERDETRIALAEARRAADSYGDQADAARANAAELEQALADAGRQAERLRAELEQGRQAALSAAREVEQARQEAQEARELRRTVVGLELALAEAREAGAEAAATSARLRERLESVRKALADDP
jgi:hypothetical protein